VNIAGNPRQIPRALRTSEAWAICENLDRTHSLPVREGRRLGIAAVAEALGSDVWVGAEGLNSGEDVAGDQTQ